MISTVALRSQSLRSSQMFGSTNETANKESLSKGCKFSPEKDEVKISKKGKIESSKASQTDGLNNEQAKLLDDFFKLMETPEKENSIKKDEALEETIEGLSETLSDDPQKAGEEIKAISEQTQERLKGKSPKQLQQYGACIGILFSILFGNLDVNDARIRALQMAVGLVFLTAIYLAYAHLTDKSPREIRKGIDSIFHLGMG
jgi:hypothetical protein